MSNVLYTELSALQEVFYVSAFDEKKFQTRKPGQYDRPNSTEVLVGADKENEGRLNGGAYHHIISFNRLAAFWDRMIDVANETEDVSDIQRIMVQVITMYQSQLENPRVQKRGTPPTSGGMRMHTLI